MGWSVLDAFLQHLTWSLGDIGWMKLFISIAAGCLFPNKWSRQLVRWKWGQTHVSFHMFAAALFVQQQQVGQEFRAGLSRDCWSAAQPELGTEPLPWERRVRGRTLEPPGGGSPHCSKIGKTGLGATLPKLSESSLLRNTFQVCTW